MELLEADDENMVVRVSKKEFGDIISAFETVKMDYDKADLSVVQMSKPRVSELLETLLMTAKAKLSPESTPEKTLDQKWDEHKRHWDLNSPSDAELARQAAADPDVAPIRTAEEVRARYKPQPPLVK